MRKKIAGMFLAGAIALSGCEQVLDNQQQRLVDGVVKTEDLDKEICIVIYNALWDTHDNAALLIDKYGYDEYEYQYDINYTNYHENGCTKYSLGELPPKYEGDQQ